MKCYVGSNPPETRLSLTKLLKGNIIYILGTSGRAKHNNTARMFTLFAEINAVKKMQSYFLTDIDINMEAGACHCNN